MALLGRRCTPVVPSGLQEQGCNVPEWSVSSVWLARDGEAHEWACWGVAIERLGWAGRKSISRHRTDGTSGLLRGARVAGLGGLGRGDGEVNGLHCIARVLLAWKMGDIEGVEKSTDLYLHA